MHDLLDDLGLDLETRVAVLWETREAFAREFRADRELRRQLSERYRKERVGLGDLLDPARDVESPLAPGLDVLRFRSARLRPVAAELRAREQAGRLSPPVRGIVPSYLHMHANRLLRSAQRQQELVLYDLLARHAAARLRRRRET